MSKKAQVINDRQLIIVSQVLGRETSPHGNKFLQKPYIKFKPRVSVYLITSPESGKVQLFSPCQKVFFLSLVRPLNRHDSNCTYNVTQCSSKHTASFFLSLSLSSLFLWRQQSGSSYTQVWELIIELNRNIRCVKHLVFHHLTSFFC